MDRWLVRVAVAEFLVIALLSAWLWGARQPEDVLIATRDYVRTRTVYDTAKVEREVAVTRYRTLRDSLVLTDTVEVVRVLAAADTVIQRDSVALAAADSALARADDVIRALKKANKPKLIQPFAEALWNPYSRQYVGRLGVDVRTIRNVSLVAAAEARASGPGVFLGARVTF